MKTQSTIIGYNKNILSLVLFLISFNTFSQTAANDDNQKMKSLQTVVEGIKEKNESIKNVENVNVMVNDMLIENPQDFKIDPKNIAMVEVVVLTPKAGAERMKPSIIINTKKK